MPTEVMTLSVGLTREQRDAVRADIDCVVDSEGGGLIHSLEPEQRDQAHAAVQTLHTALRVLDQIGWSETADQDTYSLELDPEIVEFFRGVGDRGREVLRDDLRDPGGVKVHLVKIDRAMISAAELVAEAAA